jgi:hypothetical protein
MKPYLLFLLMLLCLGCPPKNPMPADMSLDMQDMSLDMVTVCTPHKQCGQDADCQETICKGSCIGGECV